PRSAVARDLLVLDLHVARTADHDVLRRHDQARAPLEYGLERSDGRGRVRSDRPVPVDLPLYVPVHRKAVSALEIANRLNSRRLRERGRYDCRRFLLDALQMLAADETFRIDLVDVFGSRRPRREPSALRGNLEAADRRVVAWRTRKPCFDGLAGKRRGFDRVRRERGEFLFSFR